MKEWNDGKCTVTNLSEEGTTTYMCFGSQIEIADGRFGELNERLELKKSVAGM